ncbi:hypothetical protein Pyn_13452 [Prunus yedoensis var. nudiflora]|uniref:Uncharacterized protein n=1 Tax=Prunus yedoensis var. nudiflora TaxID=2094558 RepID=A0A314UBE7_PRUYE|nr:hypothetical protein Pyn_13452 [Prunus yedoensis var. nudiflora]
MNTDIAKKQVGGEMVADEPAVEKDEANEGAADKAEANIMEQVAKVDEHLAEVDE